MNNNASIVESGGEETEVEERVALIKSLTMPQGWGVSLDKVTAEESVRLDAEHYDPKVTINMEALHASNFQLVPLGELANLSLPGKFARIWADDAQHGLLYLNATDLMSYAALGEPAQVRYLSRASDVNMEDLIVQEGTILVTCSGTIGRVFEVPKPLGGSAATHDIIRVVPHDLGLKGFIRAYLASPFAQTQILSHTHGGQIDHITDQQLATCLVPKFDEKLMKEIARQFDKAEQMKQKSAEMMLDALNKIRSELSDV